ncbi:MAG TPA: hypothetical protein DDX39_09775 [Bacteroidales bacterium]|nr:MAG: hypothetical protein A2W98_01600 [Bacteroidetes bacterium GWF2_33_38]OFY90674.1 MAG: hypothetical protein A2236_04215 [Bacteroidetes bacterium RIFOXYA2_FULL_33_7]HBF88917.1 hypothetical protein [Bacteroidales bacterium]
MSKTAIIIGAGPAGLTAAYELVTRTDIKPIIFETTDYLGGISRTVNYKGNRMDIGGHRFFSKSDRVMNWWLNILPLEENAEKVLSTSKIMILRKRLSRIYFLRNFFDYPISLSFDTIKKLGFWRISKIGFSYIKVQNFPVKNIKTLEDFFISRFGRELYKTFFKDYTEKVWGVPCNEISAEWGAQRIKGLSITKAIVHAAKNLVKTDKSISQKNVETTLIEQFLYPKFGPGQLWEEVAEIVKQKGGEIHFNCDVKQIETSNNQVVAIKYLDKNTNHEKSISGDYFFSTMPVKDLISGMNSVSQNIRNIASGLQYRDFITVGLLLNKLKVKPQNSEKLIQDNWIYVQEREVKLGRIQIFNNWSPFMVQDAEKVWIGLEYFCYEGDELWSKTEEEFKQFAIQELASIDIIEKSDVVDGVVIKMPKTYPAYFGTYAEFHQIKNYVNQFENLILIGRNGMHKYNNQDHSMLTAMIAVDNIINGNKQKENIWQVNSEEEYHEKK